MKTNTNLYFLYFFIYLGSIGFGVWFLNNFDTSADFIQRLVITTFSISVLISWISMKNKIKKFKKCGLETTNLKLSKKFKTRITSKKSTDEILLDILNNYKLEKVTVKKTNEGFKLYLRGSVFDVGEVVEIKKLRYFNDAYELQLSSHPSLFLEFIYNVRNVKSIQRLKKQFHTPNIQHSAA